MAMAALLDLRCNVLLRRRGAAVQRNVATLQQQRIITTTMQRRWALQQQRTATMQRNVAFALLRRCGATVQRDVATALWRCSATRRLAANVFFFLMTLGKFKSLQTLLVHARKREIESKGELLNLVWSCSFKLVCSHSISGLLVGRDIRI
jgi:hypothetical protein